MALVLSMLVIALIPLGVFGLVFSIGKLEDEDGISTEDQAYDEYQSRRRQGRVTNVGIKRSEVITPQCAHMSVSSAHRNACIWI